MSKTKAEIFGSRLEEGWGLLSPGMKLSVFRAHKEDMRNFFVHVYYLFFCTDIDELFGALGMNMTHNNGVFYRFVIVKPALLHNVYTSVTFRTGMDG